MVDLASGLRSRFTAGATVSSDAVWSPDGKRVAYRALPSSFVVRDVDAPESSAIVVPTGGDAWVPSGWTHDGLSILSYIYRSPRGMDIGIVAADGKSAPTLLIESPAQERSPKLSPDRRWLAFMSDESGQYQVYVTAYPALGAKWPLTSNGASAFEWTGGNSMIYSDAGAQRIHAVAFQAAAGGGIDVTKRGSLLEGRAAAVNVLPASALRATRFLDSVVVPGQNADTPLVLVTNWQAEIKQ
jgi:hypothetical protein